MKHSIITLVFALVGITVFAQQQVSVNLADTKPKDLHISSGTVQLILVNTLTKRLKDVTYKIETSITGTLPGPIPLSALNGTQGAAAPVKLNNAVTCPGGAAVVANIGTVNNADTELELQQNYERIDAAINKLPAPCQQEAADLLAVQDAERKQSQFLTGLTANQKIRVTISRTQKDAKQADKYWEFYMYTESQMDKFLIHYGFTFQPNIISKYPQYYAKAGPTNPNSYTITEMNGSPQTAWKNVSPTVLLTIPLQRNYSDFMPGFTIMAGTNFSTYNAGAGFSGIIGYNALIGAGIMYTEKYTLNGQYQNGEIIKDNLTFDQLHTKRGGFEFYITIGLRLDKKPTSSSTADKNAAKPTN